MFILLAAALLGAILGLFIRRAWLALIVALICAGSAQVGAIYLARAMMAHADQAALAMLIQSYVGDEWPAAAPTLAAAGFGALIAALMMALTLKDRPEGFWLPDAQADVASQRRGKRRYAEAIQERPKHAAAESRIDRLLKQ